MTETHRRLFFAAMFALVFYLVGASFVESFVTYRTWRFVGADSFPLTMRSWRRGSFASWCSQASSRSS